MVFERRPLTEDEKARAVKAFRNGKNISQIANSMKRGHVKIREYLKNCGENVQARQSPYRKKPKYKKLCLRCDKVFLSDGDHNRVCDNCRQINETKGCAIEHVLAIRGPSNLRKKDTN